MTVGFIYKIVCLNPEVKDTYVGSCNNMTKRKCDHKTACNNSNNKAYNFNVYQLIREHGGWSNWSMIAIEQVEYNIKHELRLRERFHLENLKATLNKCIPSRTYQESQQAYREANKTEINEAKKQIITCACGTSLTKSVISRHKQSKNHKQYEQIYNFIYS
jgi:hypothetical protein